MENSTKTGPWGPTPGPWKWFGNAKMNLVYLATVSGGRRFAMRFQRWGMDGAQPAFPRNGIMVPATEFLKFEVGNPAVTGLDQAKADPSLYRLDILGIDHPDARLMEESPMLYAACKRLVASMEGVCHISRFMEAVDELREIIGRVDGPRHGEGG